MPFTYVLSDCSHSTSVVCFLSTDSVTQVALVRPLRSCTRYLVEKVDTGDHSALGLASDSVSSFLSREMVPPRIAESRGTLKDGVNSFHH